MNNQQVMEALKHAAVSPEYFDGLMDGMEFANQVTADFFDSLKQELAERKLKLELQKDA